MILFPRSISHNARSFRANFSRNKNIYSEVIILKKFLFFLFFISVISYAAAPVRASGDFDSAVFFGDSTTAHMAVRGGIPKSRVWSGPGSTVSFASVNRQKCVCIGNETLTLAEAVRRVKPSVLVITLGVSGGAGVLPKESFCRIYREMILSVKKASPDTKIFVQSILPLSDKSVNYYKKLTKDSVNEANAWIREVCSSLCVPYIDSHSLLTDGNGYLKREYQNDEYMHLTAGAYRVILANIKKSIENN